jgi:manganese/zinc/iron transport system permease protein
MDIGVVLQNVFLDYTLRTVVLGSVILGITSGVLGCFALLRRQSMLGDALSHAALPGICIAFILSGESKSPLALLLGAAAAAWIGAIVLTVITRTTRIKEDAAMGVVLVVFFGFGYVILSLLQSSAGAGQSGLDRYLFGRASSMLQSDVETMLALSVISLALVAAFFKEFKLLAFNPEYLRTIGFGFRRIDILLTTLIVIAIVIGLQTVGVVLMSAMLTAPAAAARQWTNRLSRMILIAASIGAGSGALGAIISASADRIPTGPTIVIALTLVTLFSLAFGSARGLVWSALRAGRTRSAIQHHTLNIPDANTASGGD